MFSSEINKLIFIHLAYLPDNFQLFGSTINAESKIKAEKYMF